MIFLGTNRKQHQGVFWCKLTIMNKLIYCTSCSAPKESSIFQYKFKSCDYCIDKGRASVDANRDHLKDNSIKQAVQQLLNKLSNIEMTTNSI